MTSVLDVLLKALSGGDQPPAGVYQPKPVQERVIRPFLVATPPSTPAPAPTVKPIPVPVETERRAETQPVTVNIINIPGGGQVETEPVLYKTPRAGVGTQDRFAVKDAQAKMMAAVMSGIVPGAPPNLGELAALPGPAPELPPIPAVEPEVTQSAGYTPQQQAAVATIQSLSGLDPTAAAAIAARMPEFAGMFGSGPTSYADIYKQTGEYLDTEEYGPSFLDQMLGGLAKKGNLGLGLAQGIQALADTLPLIAAARQRHPSPATEALLGYTRGGPGDLALALYQQNEKIKERIRAQQVQRANLARQLYEADVKRRYPLTLAQVSKIGADQAKIKAAEELGKIRMDQSQRQRDIADAQIKESEARLATNIIKQYQEGKPVGQGLTDKQIEYIRKLTPHLNLPEESLRAIKVGPRIEVRSGSEEGYQLTTITSYDPVTNEILSQTSRAADVKTSSGKIIDPSKLRRPAREADGLSETQRMQLELDAAKNQAIEEFQKRLTAAFAKSREEGDKLLDSKLQDQLIQQYQKPILEKYLKKHNLPAPDDKNKPDGGMGSLDPDTLEQLQRLSEQTGGNLPAIVAYAHERFGDSNPEIQQLYDFLFGVDDEEEEIAEETIAA